MLKAIILDLDGVIVTTDTLHSRAWKAMADHEGLPFDESIREALRGVSRMECVDIVLGNKKDEYNLSQKSAMAEFKNNYYKQLLETLSSKEILPGALDLIACAKSQGIKVAIGSSSKNAKTILTKVGLLDEFNVIIDGNDIAHSKPDPEVFIKAARKLKVSPADCVVIEDAYAGIDAALSAGMKAFAVGFASSYEKAQGRTPSLLNVTLNDLMGFWTTFH
ncbi:MAG: beta-phosphoglucomutase [Spirochaetaceae bacterium]|nr:beta-phosphoglucomutase [Spirochaetaceae bacterium]